ncbi:hypothetical protein SLEP1_g4894 [Rubroshorea leprosula]|uniref:Uncharacterized protein n=1 Tax=Rubroshorea leprosula TaxID=152421 RepID=A0AAV5HWJ6_9ROSI|nr:hypothetical protein SLEP1_g4894 [Rubroshorea leprosula]
MTADFHPEVKLKWDYDNEGCNIFPSNFDFEFVAVEDKEPEVVEGAEVSENELEEPMNQQPPLVE